MTTRELTRDQICELKARLLTERMGEQGDFPSLDEIAQANELISDDDIHETYGGVDFSQDDFFCSAE